MDILLGQRCRMADRTKEMLELVLGQPEVQKQFDLAKRMLRPKTQDTQTPVGSAVNKVSESGMDSSFNRFTEHLLIDMGIQKE